MAYSSLDQTKLVTGKPVSTDNLILIANNLDDLNTRQVAATSAFLNTPFLFEVLGNYPAAGNGQIGVSYRLLSANATLLGFKLFLINDGTSPGDHLDLDIQYKRGGAAFASIFTTAPSILQGGGDLSVSTGGAVLGVTNLLAGDILRLDIPRVLQGNYSGFQAALTYQPA